MTIRRTTAANLPRIQEIGTEAYGKAFYEFDGPYTPEDLEAFPQGARVYCEGLEVRGYTFF
jgi:hypothetical protein